MKYKVLKGIEIAAAPSRQLCRALETYFKLKTLSTSSRYAPNQYKDLAEATGISQRTLYNRLDLIEKFALGYKTKTAFCLVSYSDVVKMFELKSHEFYYTAFPDLQSLLKCRAIMDAHSRQRAAFTRKINQVPELAKTLISFTGSNVNNLAAAVEESQISDHANAGEPTLYELNLHRADFNVGYKYLTELFNYNSKGGAAYLKRKLAKAGLIKVTSRLFQINDHRYNSILGKVNFFRPGKKRVLAMPDKIEFLPPVLQKFDSTLYA